MTSEFLGSWPQTSGYNGEDGLHQLPSMTEIIKILK